MKRFVYKNKKTGEIVKSERPIKNNPDLVLVTQVKDGSMKGSGNVRTK